MGKKKRYKLLCFSTLANLKYFGCLKGDQEDVNIASFWHFQSECWTKGILRYVPETLSYSYTLFQGKTKLLDMQWPVYCQIIWHYFQSHGHAFAAFPMISSDSENCFTKAERASVHSQKQAGRKILPATLSSSFLCQCSRGEQRNVF